jgi:hypothetical protein
MLQRTAAGVGVDEFDHPKVFQGFDVEAAIPEGFAQLLRQLAGRVDLLGQLGEDGRPQRVRHRLGGVLGRYRGHSRVIGAAGRRLDLANGRARPAPVRLAVRGGFVASGPSSANLTRRCKPRRRDTALCGQKKQAALRVPVGWHG